MADWSKITSRGNVEDRRGLSPVMASGGLGVLGIVAIIAFNVLTGGSVDINQVNDAVNQLEQLHSAQTSNQIQPDQFKGADDYEVFTSTVLGSTNDLWQTIFAQSHQTYQKPKLVLFRDSTPSGCGGATSEVGPHYCSADQTIYIDETFFDTLQQQFGGNTTDVAQAYVIAHEVGHHVQQQLGIFQAYDQQQRQQPSQANALSVKLELQADCFAGVWAHSVAQQGVIEPGEIQEALDEAAAVGDDRIQQKVQGQITPETWTHGSSQQRIHWFTQGFDTGDPAKCQP
jgi:predicted metalloprotease